MTKWISVKEQLPKYGEEILVSDGNQITLSFLSKVKHDDSSGTPSRFTNHFIQVNTWVDLTNHVTHWMPLPEPPNAN